MLKRLTRTRSSRHSASPTDGQGAQHCLLLGPAHLPGQIPLLDLVQQKAGVRRAVGELSAATYTQRLVDGLLEAEVGLLNIAVLVRHTEVIGRRFQAIVAHHDAVALLRLSTSLGIERMNRRTEMIGAVPLRDATYAP